MKQALRQALRGQKDAHRVLCYRRYLSYHRSRIEEKLPSQEPDPRKGMGLQRWGGNTSVFSASSPDQTQLIFPARGAYFTRKSCLRAVFLSPISSTRWVPRKGVFYGIYRCRREEVARGNQRYVCDCKHALTDATSWNDAVSYS